MQYNNTFTVPTVLVTQFYLKKKKRVKSDESVWSSDYIVHSNQTSQKTSALLKLFDSWVEKILCDLAQIDK